MVTIDNERYMRITLLTQEGGLLISRKRLHQLVKETGYSDLDALLFTNQTLLTTKKARGQITKMQYEVMFPPGGAKTDTEEWDLSLLIKIIQILFDSSLSAQDKDYLFELAGIRNEVVCHTGNPSLQEVDFNKHWDKLKKCLIGLASAIDVDTKHYVSELVQKISRGLDLKDAIKKVEELCRNDESMKQIGVSKNLKELLRMVKDIHLKSKGRHITVPVFKAPIDVSGSDDDDVNLAEEILLNVAQSLVDRAEDPKDPDSVRKALTQLFDHIAGTGAIVESVERGSIALKINCNDLNGLENMLTLFRVKGRIFRMNGIENARNEVLNAAVKVEFVLPDTTIEMLTRWTEGVLSPDSAMAGDTGHHDTPEREKPTAVQREQLLRTVLATGVLLNIHHWWNGDISGERAVANIISLGLAVAGGVAVGVGGAAGGAAMGAPLGPIFAFMGAVAGAAIGYYTGYMSAKALAKLLTQWIFDLPPSEASEKAYDFLGVSRDDSNREVNSAFTRLCQIYDPAKGGEKEKWTRPQYSMAVIREDRGEGHT